MQRASCTPLPFALAALAFVACSSPKPAGTEPEAPSAPPAQVPSPAPAKTAAEGLVLTPPAEWVVEPPSGSMRKAQYVLARAGGDVEDATLVVYFFGGQGGTREANLERWAGQFEQVDGSPSIEAMLTGTRSVAGLEVLDADLTGTYVAETAPGSGVRVNKPRWRMLASIVETAHGPWYFKLVGPSATVTRWAPSYEAFLQSLRPAQ